MEEVLAGSFLDELPARLIDDKAYDADENTTSPRTGSAEAKAKMDGNYAATFGAGKWNGSAPGCTNFPRLVTCWEYHIENFPGMVRLGCITLLLRQL